MNASNSNTPARAIKAGFLLACGLSVLGAGQAAAATARDEAQAPDPFEKINRVSFYANGAVDFLLLRPAAMTYRRLMPRLIRTGLHNAFANMGEPVVLMNDVFQGHGKKAVRTFGRFAENSTIGVAGLFDPATASGLKHHDNDFGITLARYGVKSGPYIFIPLLGPATVRDGIGQLVTFGIDPFTYVRFPYSDAVFWGRTVEEGLYQRAAADKDINAIVATATDDYASFKSYYLQNREADITGEKVDVKSLPDFGEPAGSPAKTGPAAAPDKDASGAPAVEPPAPSPSLAPTPPPAADAPSSPPAPASAPPGSHPPA